MGVAFWRILNISESPTTGFLLDDGILTAITKISILYFLHGSSDGVRFLVERFDHALYGIS